VGAQAARIAPSIVRRVIHSFSERKSELDAGVHPVLHLPVSAVTR
jgi:hypothetical protein